MKEGRNGWVNELKVHLMGEGLNERMIAPGLNTKTQHKFLQNSLL